jgi:hypothetical protein
VGLFALGDRLSCPTLPAESGILLINATPRLASPSPPHERVLQATMLAKPLMSTPMLASLSKPACTHVIPNRRRNRSLTRQPTYWLVTVTGSTVFSTPRLRLILSPSSRRRRQNTSEENSVKIANAMNP